MLQAAELTAVALTHPGAVYREMLPSKVGAENPTGVKDRAAAVLLLLLRDMLDHMSQSVVLEQQVDKLISPWKAKKLHLAAQVPTTVPPHWEFSMGKL